MTNWLLAALVLGFAGSAHCIGMCGPIALALPVNRENNWSKILGISSYNLGRVTTYTLIGILFGVFGKGLQIAGILQIVSIVLGVLLILMVFLPGFLNKRLSLNKHYMRFNNSVKSQLAKLFQKKSNGSLFGLGLINGLLPCGLVFAAIIGALETGTASGGALFMFFFGIGTVPAMFALPWIAQKVSLSFRSKLRKFIPVMLFLFGSMFIVRGMNLNIPYLSPKIEVNQDVQTLDCCKATKKCESE